MSRKHLGMKRPIKQFEEHYKKLSKLINEIEVFPPNNELEKSLYLSRLKLTFNNTLIQLNNIKNTQIELLERNDDLSIQ